MSFSSLWANQIRSVWWDKLFTWPITMCCRKQKAPVEKVWWTCRQLLLILGKQLIVGRIADCLLCWTCIWILSGPISLWTLLYIFGEQESADCIYQTPMEIRFLLGSDNKRYWWEKVEEEVKLPTSDYIMVDAVGSWVILDYRNLVGVAPLVGPSFDGYNTSSAIQEWLWQMSPRAQKQVQAIRLQPSGFSSFTSWCHPFFSASIAPSTPTYFLLFLLFQNLHSQFPVLNSCFGTT